MGLLHVFKRNVTLMQRGGKLNHRIVLLTLFMAILSRYSLSWMIMQRNCAKSTCTAQYTHT